MSTPSKVIPRRIEHRPFRHSLQMWYTEIRRKVRNSGPENETLKLSAEYITSFIVIISIVAAIGISVYLGSICHRK